MSDEQHHDLLDAWAAWELERAPRLRPTARMLRILASRRQLVPRRLAWGLALAAMAAGAALLASLEPPQPERVSPVEIRTGLNDPGEKGTARGGPRSGPKGGPPACTSLLLQSYRIGEERIAIRDLLGARSGGIELDAEDNYALKIKVNLHAFAYAFQLDASGGLAPLFPRAEQDAPAKPLPPRESHRIPRSPLWFHRTSAEGGARLYLALSSRPREEWDRLVAGYVDAATAAERARIAARLQDELETLAAHPSDETRVYRLNID